LTGFPSGIRSVPKAATRLTESAPDHVCGSSRKGGSMKRLALILMAAAAATLVVVGWLASERAIEES
jgi:hypothetical protein